MLTVETRRMFGCGMHAAGLIMRIALGAILAYGGATKLFAAGAFLNAVYGYELLGKNAGLAFAIVLPPAELVLGACLVLGLFTQAALLLSAGFFGVFVVALASVVTRGIEAQCGCFGSTDASIIGASDCLRTCVFFVAALLCLWISFSKRHQWVRRFGI